MNRFAELLDRLAYEPARNAKLRLMTDYFRSTPDPERGWALAALTGELTFPYAKSGLIRNLIAERTDPLLFELSYDYVGDLSETVALMWPAPSVTASADQGREEISLTTVIGTLARLGKAELPSRLARWFDALDETGRRVFADRRVGAISEIRARGAQWHRSPGHRNAVARVAASLRRSVCLAGRSRRKTRKRRARAIPATDARARHR